MTVTDKSLDEFGNDIIKAAEMLQVATLSLRSLYSVNSSSVDSFVKLRQKINNEAKVYSKNILPISNELVRSISIFCDYYNYFDLDEFGSYIHSFVREIKKGAEKCELTLKLNKLILMEFKNNEDEVEKVLKQLESKTKDYERKKKELMNSANVKLKWAIGLALIPVINVIVGPIVYMDSRKSIINAIAESEEELLTVAAAEAIKGPLITSITTLISTFNNIAGFFNVLIIELTTICESLNRIHDDNEKELLYDVHYKTMKNKCMKIKEACSYYFSKTPDSMANLMAIPDDYDKNYVEEWLLKRS